MLQYLYIINKFLFLSYIIDTIPCLKTEIYIWILEIVLNNVQKKQYDISQPDNSHLDNSQPNNSQL